VLKTHKDLLVWQKAFAFCKRVYEVTREFPDEERFGLTSQLRRGAVSVASNLAEGYNRGTRPDYIRFLWIANGAVAELDTQLLIADEMRYSRGDSIASLIEDLAEIERMLRALIRSLQSKSDG
jgi:four helix bundle protein